MYCLSYHYHHPNRKPIVSSFWCNSAPKKRFFVMLTDLTTKKPIVRLSSFRIFTYLTFNKMMIYIKSWWNICLQLPHKRTCNRKKSVIRIRKFWCKSCICYHKLCMCPCLNPLNSLIFTFAECIWPTNISGLLQRTNERMCGKMLCKL